MACVELDSVELVCSPDWAEKRTEETRKPIDAKPVVRARGRDGACLPLASSSHWSPVQKVASLSHLFLRQTGQTKSAATVQVQWQLPHVWMRTPAATSAPRCIGPTYTNLYGITLFLIYNKAPFGQSLSWHGNDAQFHASAPILCLSLNSSAPFLSNIPLH